MQKRASFSEVKTSTFFPFFGRSKMQKRGWIRIAEAVAAILIVSGVLLFVYSRGIEGPNNADYIYSLQMGVLDSIASDESLRQAALAYDETSLNNFALSRIPSSFNLSVKVCDLGTGTTLGCNLGFQVDKNIYVEEVIVASNLTYYDNAPRRVRLFVWEK